MADNVSIRGMGLAVDVYIEATRHIVHAARESAQSDALSRMLESLLVPGQPPMFGHKMSLREFSETLSRAEPETRAAMLAVVDGLARYGTTNALKDWQSELSGHWLTGVREREAAAGVAAERAAFGDPSA